MPPVSSKRRTSTSRRSASSRLMPPTMSIVQGIVVLRPIVATRLRQSNGMPRYWTMTRPPRTRTCGVAPSNRARYRSAAARPARSRRSCAPERNVSRAALMPAEWRGMLRRAGRLGGIAFGRGPETGRLGLGQVGHPRQEVVDERELLRRVAADLLGSDARSSDSSSDWTVATRSGTTSTTTRRRSAGSVVRRT